jgi:hypothetical protein
VTPLSQRSYLIHVPGGEAYPAYVSVFASAQLGQFYDVQGTTWTTAPQFDSPDQTVQVGGRTYYLFYEGSNLKMVAWYEHDAVYWVRNTLTDSIGAGELLAIAEQTTPFIAAGAGPGQQPVILKAAGVPARVVHKTTLSTRETVGSVAGIVTLVALPLLALLAILLLRELRRPRSELVSGAEIGSRLPGFDAAVSGGGAAGLGGGVGAGASVAGLGGGAGAVPRSGINPYLAGARLPVAARPGTYTPPRWTEGTRTYRHSRLRTPAGVLAVLLVLAAIAAGVVFLLGGRGATPAQHRTSARAASLLPAVPVTVLNAGSTPGAAGQLASQLRARRVSVSEVKNVTDTLPPGLEVLYAPGQRAQAMRVARLFSNRAATVGPIDPVIAAVAGTGAQVVVVIT